MKQKNLILMVVAVGCGLAAALLTSQMSAKTAHVEKVKVLVAAKDLTVGTQLGKDELKDLVKWKEVPKDGLSQTIVETEEELVDKRLTRTIRADETFNKADVTKNGIISIPEGMSMVALPISLPQAVAGFVGPGSRVDVLASVRLHNKLTALPILVNMLVLAVDASTQYPNGAVAFQNLSTVSFAVDRKQALLIKLAQARNCDLSLLLRRPEDKETENDKAYKVEEVEKLLQDDKLPSKIENLGGEGRQLPQNPDGSAETPAPVAKRETVKVPYAVADVKAGTDITADLLADPAVFGTKELPKDLAEDAITDLKPFVGQVFPTGLGKGQWVTRGLVGKAEPKPSDRSAFSAPKPGPDAAPAKPAAPARKTHDVSMHTANGTKVFRYEEVKPGDWRLMGEVAPHAAAPAKPAPRPTPEKVD